MDIYLARAQGYCAGVHFAVNIVEKALKKYGTPLYVFHEIVHNTYVVSSFKSQGVVFVEDIEQVPVGSHLIFSAHGVPPSIIEQSNKRNLNIIDATCPLVGKVHNEAISYSQKGYDVILIGHKGHQEIIGTSGYVNPRQLSIVQKLDDINKLKINKDNNVAFITQTTLSVDETKEMIKKLKSKFKNLTGPSKTDLCYATQVRQNAVKELASICDIIIICGSPNSSNSNRLRETGKNCGVDSYIIDSADELNMELLDDKTKIGISSGASVPNLIVDRVIDKIKLKFKDVKIHTFEGSEKHIRFKLPEI